MKKTILSSIIMFILLLVCNSCSKKQVNTNNSLPNTSNAKLEYNTSNFGIYKGVFVGSSGVIIVDISNNGSIFATLIINGVTYNFSTSQNIQQGQLTVINFISGSNSFTFSVNANGTNPSITNLNINGHPNAAIIAIKEISSTIVKCYEGTFSGGDNGTFNLIVSDNKIKFIGKSNIFSNSIYTGEGNIINNQCTGISSTGATISGILNGNNLSGTWINTKDTFNGTFSGIRTY